MIQKLDFVADLIRNGQVRLGMTRRELQALMGVPDDVGGTSRKYHFPSIFMYGDVQFVFPSAKSQEETVMQGLCYVYVDDSVEGVEEPLFLLR
jgi:hypothetical protein